MPHSAPCCIGAQGGSAATPRDAPGEPASINNGNKPPQDEREIFSVVGRT